MRRLDDVARRNLEGFGQRVVEGQGGLSAIHPALVVAPQVGGVVPRDQGENRLPFIRDLAAENRGHRALGVQIDHQYPVPVERGRHRQMRRSGRLADPTFEVGDRDDLGGQIRRAPRQVFLGFGSLLTEEDPQAEYLVEGEPFGAVLGLGPTLWQIWILAQDAPKMGLGHGDQIAGDLPGREQAQVAPPILIQSAR